MVGSIGPLPTIIQTDTNSFGSTSLVELGNNFFLYVAGTSTGPELSYGGSAVVAGEFGDWTPIAAVQTASGYDVAWKSPSTNEYGVWTTDSGGNFNGQPLGGVPGNSPALETLELTFNQDLNRDGYIDSPTTVINATGDIVITVNPFAQAATIAAGATLEFTGADTGSVTFEGSTGNLILDHSTQFGGQILGLSGTGSVATSDQLDLKDIAYGSGTTASYSGTASGGTLTVSDGTDIAHIPLSGDYLGSTFSLSSDGNGGTVVIDPVVAQSLVGGSFSFGESDSTGNYTASVSPQNGGVGYVGSFTVDAVNTTNGQESVGWQFDLNPDSITQTITQSYNVAVADAQPNGTTTAATQSISVMVGAPGNDTFVFKPGFGTDVIANATTSDSIELDGFSSVTSINQLQTLLTEAQNGQAQSLFESANSGHDTVINLGNHDSITLANVQLAALHASNFIIH